MSAENFQCRYDHGVEAGRQEQHHTAMMQFKSYLPSISGWVQEPCGAVNILTLHFWVGPVPKGVCKYFDPPFLGWVQEFSGSVNFLTLQVLSGGVQYGASAN